MLVPDGPQAALFRDEVAPNLEPGAALLFAHGFSVHYGRIPLPEGIDVIMVAPKGPGHIVRRLYEEGYGTPALIAVAQDASGQAREIALAYAAGIGAGRAGILETTFDEETESDLFGEQSVLCGGLTQLIQAGFETLVEAGYAPEIAYYECVHEVKLIVDLIFEGGIERMHYSISDTAEYGSIAVGPRVVDPHVKENMKKALTAIQDGSFAREWIAEMDKGSPSLAGGPREARRDADRAGRQAPARARPPRQRAGGAWRRLTSRLPCSATAPSAPAVNRLLNEQADDIERATGHRFRVVKALVREPRQASASSPPTAGCSRPTSAT